MCVYTALIADLLSPTSTQDYASKRVSLKARVDHLFPSWSMEHDKALLTVSQKH